MGHTVGRTVVLSSFISVIFLFLQSQIRGLAVTMATESFGFSPGSAVVLLMVNRTQETTGQQEKHFFIVVPVFVDLFHK